MNPTNVRRFFGAQASLAARCGFVVGVAGGSAYLLLGGEYVAIVPRWAEIIFYPGFFAGFKTFYMFHSEGLAKVIGVLAVGLTYALISVFAHLGWRLLKRR